MKLLSFFNNSAQVYVIEANDFIKPDDQDLSDFISILSDEERERFYRFKNEKAQFTFLTARVYLRVLLLNIIKKLDLRNATPLQCFALQPLRLACHPGARMHSQPPVGRQSLASPNPASQPFVGQLLRLAMTANLRFAEENKVEQANCKQLIIETTPSGKPYLKDYPNLFFNLSHTDNLILIAIANSPVGVDVEKNERNADKEAIIKHFFSEKEQQSFFSQSENKRQLAFVKGWTRKEAILKATGEGLTAMKNYEVSFEIETQFHIIKNSIGNSFEIKDFTPIEGYAACIALLKTAN